MSLHEIVLDPTFEALLREIASDPRSSLLRAKRPRTLPSLFAREEAVKTSLTGLTPAERHLVGVYRSEAADLMRKVALELLFGGEASARFMSRFASLNVRIPERSLVEIRKRAEWCSGIDGGLSAEQSHSVTHLLRAIGTGEACSAYALASTAYALEPRSQTVLLAAIDLCCRDQHRSAERLFRQVIDRSLAENEVVRAWEGVSHIQWRQQRYKEALAADRAAALGRDEQIISRLNACAHALQTGELSDLIATASEVDERVQADHPAVTRFVQGIAQQRRRGDWLPTREAGVLARSLRNQLGGASARIVDEFVS